MKISFVEENAASPVRSGNPTLHAWLELIDADKSSTVLFAHTAFESALSDEPDASSLSDFRSAADEGYASSAASPSPSRRPEVRQAARGITIFTMSAGDERTDMLESGADTLIDNIIRLRRWPCLAMSMPRSFAVRYLKQLVEMNVELPTSRSILAALLLVAISEGESFEHGGEIELSPESLELAELNSTERLVLLRLTLETSNIEDLFPSHQWSTYQAESAAACYQTLAAHFIQLGDPAGAQECLRCSDALEESPRALALSGMISQMNGETLGAVANMVSSLQQYEIRKKESEGHYVRFEPSNFEEINSHLLAGLDALNKKNNEQALNHFTKAVFTFDSFYSDCGFHGLVDRSNDSAET